MSPIEARIGPNFVGRSSEGQSRFLAEELGITIYWAGDEVGQVLLRKNGRELASFILSKVGQEAGYGVEVVVRPIEVGGEERKVIRKLLIRRI